MCISVSLCVSFVCTCVCVGGHANKLVTFLFWIGKKGGGGSVMAEEEEREE